ncbi:hypothetical protein ACFS5M_13745 [Lacinutrix iliipiscaria]|uniref:Uncharacterized protein n=1 Tax=Lacinutrix iliipiscaria TaxID=1230532 RepID=A0ABW5WTX5_9FLAO
MKSYTTIIGGVIALIIILPLIFIQVAQKRKKSKSKKRFIDEAQKNNLNITEHDFWGTYYAIAIDERANMLIYSKIIEDEHITKIINLDQLATCEIIKTNRNYTNKKTTKIETDKIDLILCYKDSKKTKEVLEFYNVDINFEMSNEVLLLEKWEALIKSKLSRKKAYAA